VVTVVIDSPARIAAWFDLIDQITAHRGLVTSELVPAAVAPEEAPPSRGLHLARPRIQGTPP
jgi:hypothetical protein